METSAFDIPDPLLASDPPPRLIYESGRGYCRIYSTVRQGRRIALKVLKPQYLDSTIHRDLLRKEYEIGHTLYHPNIASTLGFEEIDGLGPAIVMEFVDGITLEEYISSNGTMERDATMAVTEQICDALAYLHSHQLLHRDLKPANIMITHSGRYVKLIDFGLSDGTSFTNYKYAGGTLHYSAPEQLADGVDNDPRADIYSLGVIMREMCSDRKGGYRHIADRCCAEIPEERPADASKIPGMIRRFDTMRRRRLIGFTAAIPALAVVAALALFRPTDQKTSPSPTAHAKEQAVADTATRIVHDTARTESEPPTPPAHPPAVTPAAPRPATQPAAQQPASTTDEDLNRKKIDAMVSYAQNYTRSELEKWYTSDSSAFSYNDFKIIQHLDKYVEEQCGGDATAIALIKPAITETAYAAMRKFYTARRNKQ